LLGKKIYRCPGQALQGVELQRLGLLSRGVEERHLVVLKEAPKKVLSFYGRIFRKF
jgi:hypothetical protein